MDGSDCVNPASQGQKLTYDDFLLFPDDGMRHFFIRLWLEDHPIARIYFASLDVVLSNVDVVVPDLLYASNQRLDQITTEKNWQGAPNLVIEIASPGTRRRDETIKRELYERSGVEEYWIVEPDAEVVRVHRRETGRFSRMSELSNEANDVVTTPLLPGLTLPLSQIFRE